MDSMWSLFIRPTILLYLINSLFLVFGSTFLWSYFKKLILSTLPESRNSPLFLKSLLFFSVLFFGVLVEIIWGPLKEMAFFPLFTSSFIKLNAIGIIIALLWLFFIRAPDNKSTAHAYSFRGIYFPIIYLFYLIVIMATVITRMSTPFDHLLPNLDAQLVNQYISYPFFILYLMFALVLTKFKRKGKIAWFLIYTLIMVLINK